MTLNELRKLCMDISFRDEQHTEWILVSQAAPDSYWLQWQFYARDNKTGRLEEQHGRKWRISKHSTKDEVVKTAFAAMLLAIEHEARERFRYKGEPIFHPHTDVEALVELQKAGRRVTREGTR